jgi:hypothetical protein
VTKRENLARCFDVSQGVAHIKVAASDVTSCSISLFVVRKN